MGYYLLFSTVVYVFYFQQYCLFGILFPANRVSFIVCCKYLNMYWVSKITRNSVTIV